jgi:hypothetical protein
MKAICAITLSLSAMLIPGAYAAVTADQAAKLKSTLTPMGAERAGNADKTIPPWEGGYTKVPANYKNGDARTDLFADEKPLFSITAKNLDAYKSKLSAGAQALLQKYPTYRIDVYPTHRTAAAVGLQQFVHQCDARQAGRRRPRGGGCVRRGALSDPEGRLRSHPEPPLVLAGVLNDQQLQCMGRDFRRQAVVGLGGRAAPSAPLLRREGQP